MIMTVVWLIAHPYLKVTGLKLGQISPHIRVSVSLFLKILNEDKCEIITRTK